jgi:Protein of unknown function (DUF3431)
MDIVVARYKESVAWLAPLAKHVKLYNKGGTPVDISCNVVDLPNVGRESHSYLKYILDNYDRLPQVVVFTQGAIEEELEEQYPYEYATGQKTSAGFMIELAQSALQHSQSQNLFLNERIPPPFRATPEARMPAYKGEILDDAGMTLGEWYQDRVGRPYPASPPWYIHALFAVRRERILQHPRELYERLIKDVDTSRNPEVGHYFEKTWYLLFSSPLSAEQDSKSSP